jgi:hypothetical protein
MNDISQFLASALAYLWLLRAAAVSISNEEYYCHPCATQRRCLVLALRKIRHVAVSYRLIQLILMDE